MVLCSVALGRQAGMEKPASLSSQMENSTEFVLLLLKFHSLLLAAIPVILSGSLCILNFTPRAEIST